MIYACDPHSNTECTKENCFLNGGECHSTTEWRYSIKDDVRKRLTEAHERMILGEKFHYLVTAVCLPTGAVELAINTTDLAKKIEYILSAYDQWMLLKTNDKICMVNAMIV